MMKVFAWDKLLRDPEHDRKWWAPMRAGFVPHRVPRRIDVLMTPQGCDVNFTFGDPAPPGTVSLHVGRVAGDESMVRTDWVGSRYDGR